FVAGVGTGWEILGMRGQLFDWLDVMLKEPLPTGSIRAQAVATAVILLSNQDAGRAVSVAQHFYQESDRRDDREAALAELSLGWALRYSGSPEPAIPHLREAANRFDRLDQLRSDDASNRQQFVRLLDGFRRIGDQRCVARCLLGIGRADVADGDLEPARRHLTECAFIADAVGDPLALVAALRLVARCG